MARSTSRSSSGVAAAGARTTTSCVKVRITLPSGQRGPERVLASSHRAHAVAHDAAEHDDAAIGRGQMLERVHGDRPLARLGVEVGGKALALAVRAVS